MCSDEDAFRRVIDETPDDQAPRLTFADWLEERGDERAEGYRALAKLGKYTAAHDGGSNVGWNHAGGFQFVYEWWCDVYSPFPRHDYLPKDWWNLIVAQWEWKETDYNGNEKIGSKDFGSAKAAEDAAAVAFAKLPYDRRQQLLKGRV